MNVLLATPYLSAAHWDAGLFWLHALSRAGHSVQMWDTRLGEPAPHHAPDLAIVLKGRAGVQSELPPGKYPKVCYYPDDLRREEWVARELVLYDRVFTCLRPTPNGLFWLPGFYDPQVHKPLPVPEKTLRSVFIGTGTERKWSFLQGMQVEHIFGNDWERFHRDFVALQGSLYSPVYIWEVNAILNAAKVSINIHRDGNLGVNRRLFESMAVTFTLTDVVPGVEEILGESLTAAVGFRTPEEGKEKLAYYLSNEGRRLSAWEAERNAIRSFTYDEAVRKVVTCVGLS